MIDPIDRLELRVVIQNWIEAHANVDDTDGVGLLEDVLWEINAQPSLTPQNEPLTLEQLRASPHGKIKDSTLQSICNRANEIACRPPEGEV